MRVLLRLVGASDAAQERRRPARGTEARRARGTPLRGLKRQTGGVEHGARHEKRQTNARELAQPETRHAPPAHRRRSGHGTQRPPRRNARVTLVARGALRRCDAARSGRNVAYARGMKISKRTRQKFADFCSGYSTLRPIREAFEAEDFVAQPKLRRARGLASDVSWWGRSTTASISATPKISIGFCSSTWTQSTPGAVTSPPADSCLMRSLC